MNQIPGRLKTFSGLFCVAFSLILLRLFQLSDANLAWVLMMGVGVPFFALGVKWVTESIRILYPYKRLWPVFSVSMALAWMIHAGKIEEVAAQSWLGEVFGAVTVQTTAFLFRVSGIAIGLQGSLLLMPPPSKVTGVLITPLCGGFLSFLMFTIVFAIVLFDVGTQLGRCKLLALFLVGAVVTLLISIVRVYLVLAVGYFWGLDAMMLVHDYLGYVLFLSFVSAFWYIALKLSSSSGQAHANSDSIVS